MAYISIEELLRIEATQLLEETGSDTGLAERIDQICKSTGEGSGRDAALLSLYDEYANRIAAADASDAEPNELNAILAAAVGDVESTPLDHSTLTDRMEGAWLGRVAGCMLGKPVEGLPREEIDSILADAGEPELLDYFPMPQNSSHHYARFDNPVFRRCTRNNIVGGVSDDDINYTVLGLRILEERGRGFTPEDVANAWLAYMPAAQCFTAERAAYRNLVNNLLPPQTATYRNPYREWIGAQIRADAWGYANPGNPRAAAAMAWRDASISHRKNGIYGEMWAAACIAAAFSESTPRSVLKAGVSVLPERSRLYQALEDVLRFHAEDPSDWRGCWQHVMKQWESLHWIHTINNACFVAIGLLYGDGAFGKSIGIAVNCGFDTDCNGATAGSIVGAMIGASLVTERWSAPLQNRVETTLATMTTEQITTLAQRTLRAAAAAEAQ